MAWGKTAAAYAAALIISLSTQVVSAQERPAYDRMIEEAAIARVQTKLGPMRGPLGLNPGGRFDPARAVKRTVPWVWLNFTPRTDSPISG
ncbi:MAG: hypothetical protein CML31_16975 [Rhizobiales bacterium]|nr:hypothetical protein [Hoeflea sp.]MBG21618.1 hypothetical protein [Hyphomicrobiales bacterium]|tara:strand:- start:226 stop:495 length:270 start_codon:yes stop_codon:yes gene_type:complete